MCSCRFCFFPGMLYLMGILTGVLVAWIFKKTTFRGEAVPFVMELPNYRMPSPKNVLQLMWDKAKDFLQRAFTVIFLATLVIWFLQNFGTNLNIVEDSSKSILAVIAGAVAPIFKPMGLGDWRIVTSLQPSRQRSRRWQASVFWYSVCSTPPASLQSPLCAESLGQSGCSLL